MEKFYLEVFYLRFLLWEGKKDTGKKSERKYFLRFFHFFIKVKTIFKPGSFPDGVWSAAPNPTFCHSPKGRRSVIHSSYFYRLY